MAYLYTSMVICSLIIRTFQFMLIKVSFQQKYKIAMKDAPNDPQQIRLNTLTGTEIFIRNGTVTVFDFAKVSLNEMFIICRTLSPFTMLSLQSNYIHS